MRKDNFKLLPFILFYIALTIFVSDHTFFWDTIQLGSEHAHWYYENNFTKFWLPDQFDSGHFPVFGMYLALSWKIFGKNLLVSHFSMLPFLIGIVLQSNLLLKKYVETNVRPFALLLFLADSVLLSQSTLVSPDIALVFFFLWSLNTIAARNFLWLSFALIGLTIVSMRGMMLAVACYLISLLYIQEKNSKKRIEIAFKAIFPFVPAAIVCVLFLAGHYIEKGWIGYHTESPWASSFESVDMFGFVKNIAVLSFRLIDFGRMFVVAVLIAVAVKKRKTILQLFCKTEKAQPSPLSMALIVAVCITPAMLFHKHLLAHRYLLPLSLMITLTAIHFCNKEFNKRKYYLKAVMLIGTMSGYFWVYPQPIATGWDSTPAHLPYYKLREQMIDFINTENIDFKEVGTCFPNRSKHKYTNLNNDTRSFSYLNLNTNKYILYSNIFNDVSNEQLSELKKMTALKILKKGQIQMVLYENLSTE